MTYGPDFSSVEAAALTCNHSLFDPSSKAGHYESYFQRANHPSRPLAFWIRYTVFCPKGAPERALGELWAIYLNGETGVNVAVKSEWPLEQTSFARERFDVNIGGARLGPQGLEGQAQSNGHKITWNLRYSSNQQPLLFFPLALYRTKLPKAKALVGAPQAIYNGQLTVNGEVIAIDGWCGSQNHNWGVKHTDHYAWGQVAGFDNDRDAFLEVGTARLKIGPFWTPFLTPLVLRLGQETIASNGPAQIIRNQGYFNYFAWTFSAHAATANLVGRIYAPASRFVGLTYYNPPGGSKTCLNSKLAACELSVHFKDGRPPLTLQTASRAAFEILTDDKSHGVKLYV